MQKRLAYILTTVSVIGSTAVSAFATTPPPITESLTNAITPVKTDAIAALAAVAPVGIAIMGGFLVWKFGVKFFKGLAK